MKNNKQIKKTIISSFILLSLILSFSQIIYTNRAEALIGNEKLNWENPNKDGKNPYKITTDAILNPQTLTQVVGCTGIVDTISIATTSFIKKILSKKARDLGKIASKETIEKVCASIKAGAEGVVSGIGAGPAVPYSDSLIQVIKDSGACDPSKTVKDPEALRLAMEQAEKEDADRKRANCFDGLAYTLAKNQLTSMTRETINWINTGFNGNPMYVQNAVSLTNSIEKNVLDTGIAVFANGAFPYGDTFSTMAVNSYKRNTLDNGIGFLNSLGSDLAAFITDTKSYTDTDIAGETMTARQRAQRANDIFSNDFSTGGWDAWNALTQRDQNNPLGFTMQASQYLANRTAQQINETKDELVQNNGFLSQKECTLWNVRNDKGDLIFSNKDIWSQEKVVSVFETTESGDKNDECIKWKVTTPGSMIKEKLSTYINSAERQLEMANGINDVLNSLFTKLIQNFRSEGLFGLSQEPYYDENNSYKGAGGYGVNNGEGFDPKDFSNFENNYLTGSTYTSDFDLTRDLGNTYIRASTRSLGGWDAKNGKTMSWNENNKKWEYDGGELNINLGTWDEKLNNGKGGYEPAYYYYTTVYAGNTKLFNEGYSGWAVGDRAFWDGEKWQNWKKDQTSPIEKRGTIQIQSDYIVAAKEILKKLPNVMPKIGELDYCIPGPNPNYEATSREVSSLFLDYAGTLGSDYIPSKTFVRDGIKLNISGEGDSTYEQYKSAINFGEPETKKRGAITNFDKITQSTKTDWRSLDMTTIWANLQSFPALGIEKKDSTEDLIMEFVSKLQIDIEKGISGFLTRYKTNVFEKLYVKNMQPEYIDNELTGISSKNTSYVEMLDEGYNITKNMVEDSEEIASAIADYSSSVSQAQSNISKLNVIRSEVTKIIKTAQGRRDANLIEILNREAIAEGRTERLTPEKYKEIYKDCLEEEEVLYYDENDIIKNSNTEEGRCFDGLDNDLDGLTDSKDSDCANAINNTNTSGGTTGGTSTAGPNTTGGSTGTGGNGSISAGSPMKDIDGNTYNTIKIGNQTWMAENLRTTKFKNGDIIPNVTEDSEWNSLTNPAWSDYGNDDSNGYTYGHLYNWYAMNDSRQIAPAGWHVPNETDWYNLYKYLIENGYNWPSSNTTDNKTAKSIASTTLWSPSNTRTASPGYNQSSNNSSGFNALPSGWRRDGNFVSLGMQSYWWVNQGISNELASGIDYNMDFFGLSKGSKINNGHSIRLIKDN